MYNLAQAIPRESTQSKMAVLEKQVSVTFTVSVWLFVTESQPNDFPGRSQWPPLELIGPEGMLAVLVLLTGAEYNWI